MPQIPWKVQVTEHPGSTREDINNEPDWANQHRHDHRVGYRNQHDRVAGITHHDDEKLDNEHELDEEAKQKYDKLKEKAKNGDLVNFRDLIEGQEDLHLRHPENRSLGWRYMLDFTEDWVKNEEEWPANVKKRQQEEKAKKEKSEKEGPEEQKPVGANTDEEKWKRDGGHNKHHDAYAEKSESDSGYDSEESNKKTEYERLRERYSPSEIALLQSLQHEKDHISKLEQNDGRRKVHNITIEARSPSMKRTNFRRIIGFHDRRI